MTLFDTSPKRWLFCLTHPDDELAIGAWIRKLTLTGNEVFLSWTHSTPVRETEAADACDLLGIPASRTQYFRAPDGQICDHLNGLLPMFREWMNAVQPDRVVCGAFEQGHLDHDATNWLVNQAFAGPVLEIPLYHTYVRRIQRLNRFSEPGGEEVHMLNEDDRAFKKRLARCYPSQSIWRICATYETVRRLGAPIPPLLQTERMRLQRHQRFDLPNHPAHLARRVASSKSWHRWLGALDTATAKG